MPPSSKAKAPKAAGKPAALTSYRERCPITGEEIKVVKAGDSWVAFTSLWTSRPFPFKDMLLYALSHSDGRIPDMPRPGVTVLRDANEPPEKHAVGPDI